MAARDRDSRHPQAVFLSRRTGQLEQLAWNLASDRREDRRSVEGLVQAAGRRHQSALRRSRRARWTRELGTARTPGASGVCQNVPIGAR